MHVYVSYMCICNICEQISNIMFDTAGTHFSELQLKISHRISHRVGVLHTQIFLVKYTFSHYYDCIIKTYKRIANTYKYQSASVQFPWSILLLYWQNGLLSPSEKLSFIKTRIKHCRRQIQAPFLTQFSGGQIGHSSFADIQHFLQSSYMFKTHYTNIILTQPVHISVNNDVCMYMFLTCVFATCVSSTQISCLTQPVHISANYNWFLIIV